MKYHVFYIRSAQFRPYIRSVTYSKYALALFISYLNNRSQTVILNGNTSTYIQINKGIPQGFILGPVFFNIYISQFTKSQLSCLQHYYADDAQVYLSFRPDESKQAVAAINFDLNQISAFSVKHCLQINASKSTLIIFGKKADRGKFLSDNHCIMLNNQEIKACNSVKSWD